MAHFFASILREASILTIGLLALAGGGIQSLFGQIGVLAIVVLAILLVMSVVSWAIIFQKLGQFSSIHTHTSRFLDLFRSGNQIPDPRSLTATAEKSPLAAVFLAGHRELQSQLSATSANPGHRGLKSINAISARMQLASAEEVRKVEKWLPWLATTGSVSPFIGLFGTVWGVINAFLGLGQSGVQSIQAVAPGIAEALIATAAGLFAAIPAVMAYNHFVHDVKDLATRMDNFNLEFTAQVEKTYAH